MENRETKRMGETGRSIHSPMSEKKKKKNKSPKWPWLELAFRRNNGLVFKCLHKDD